MAKRTDEDLKTPPPVPDERAAGFAHAISQTSRCIESLPKDIRDLYEIHEWRHACAILKNDYPNEFRDIIEVLRRFRLKRSHIAEPGGRKSKVAEAIDSQFYAKNPPWVERSFSTKIVVDGFPTDSPTHTVDCFRNGVAVELEWNN